MIHHFYFEQIPVLVLQDVFTYTGCSVFIGAELSNRAKIFTPSLWIEQTFKHMFTLYDTCVLHVQQIYGQL